MQALLHHEHFPTFSQNGKSSGEMEECYWGLHYVWECHCKAGCHDFWRESGAFDSWLGLPLASVAFRDGEEALLNFCSRQILTESFHRSSHSCCLEQLCLQTEDAATRKDCSPKVTVLPGILHNPPPTVPKSCQGQPLPDSAAPAGCVPRRTTVTVVGEGALQRFHSRTVSAIHLEDGTGRRQDLESPV